MLNNYRCSLFCSFYKGQNFIEQYLANCLEQSIFKDIEFIFLDCASPENEQDFILPFTEQYDNIKYFKLNKDPGLYNAWNEAVTLCSSSVIGNWNIDDRKNKEGLEILLCQFEKDPQLDMAYGFTYVSHKANERYVDNSFLEIYPYLPHSLSNLLQNNSPHCMPLWRKNIHSKIGYFDESYKTAADGDLWLRCCVGGCKITMVNHPVGLYYENPTGRSTNPETLSCMVSEVTQMRKKYNRYL